MLHDKGKEQDRLFVELNDIATFLAEGEVWHRKAGTECIKIAIRGIAEWHRVESLGDKLSHDRLDEILMEKLGYAPTIDSKIVDTANKYTINNIEDFKAHHKEWIKREKVLINTLNMAISEAGTTDMGLYNYLCKLAEDVQNEVNNVKRLYDSFELAGWQGHDICVKSKWIEDYFHKEYKLGKQIRFRIG